MQNWIAVYEQLSKYTGSGTLFDRLIVSCLRRIGSYSTINGGTLCEVWRKCVCTYLSLYVIRKCTLISQLLAKGGGVDSGIHKAKLSFVVFLHFFFSLEIWKCGRGQWGSFTQTGKWLLNYTKYHVLCHFLHQFWIRQNTQN